MTSILLAQSNGKGLRVFIAKSFNIHTAQLRGDDNAIAFVASGPITVDGLMDASAYRAFGGPGALRTTSACTGASGAYGGGGGGNGTAGGNGSANRATSTGTGRCRRCPTNQHVRAARWRMQRRRRGRNELRRNWWWCTSVRVAHLNDHRVNWHCRRRRWRRRRRRRWWCRGGTVLIESPSVTINGAVTANGGAGGACEAEGSHSTPTRIQRPAWAGVRIACLGQVGQV